MQALQTQFAQLQHRLVNSKLEDFGFDQDTDWSLHSAQVYPYLLFYLLSDVLRKDADTAAKHRTVDMINIKQDSQSCRDFLLVFEIMVSNQPLSK